MERLRRGRRGAGPTLPAQREGEPAEERGREPDFRAPSSSAWREAPRAKRSGPAIESGFVRIARRSGGAVEPHQIGAHRLTAGREVDPHGGVVGRPGRDRPTPRGVRTPRPEPGWPGAGAGRWVLRRAARASPARVGERGISRSFTARVTSSVALWGPVCSRRVVSLQPGPVGTKVGSGKSTRESAAAGKSQSSAGAMGLLAAAFGSSRRARPRSRFRRLRRSRRRSPARTGASAGASIVRPPRFQVRTPPGASSAFRGAKPGALELGAAETDALARAAASGRGEATPKGV